MRRRRRRHVLTPRDEAILRWIGRHGVVTTQQVALRFFWRPERRACGRVAALRRLQALEEMRYIRRDRPLARHADVLRLRNAGAVAAGLGIKPAPLIETTLQHNLELVGLVEYLVGEYPGSELLTARELRAVRWKERQMGTRAEGMGRCPDAILRIPRMVDGARTMVTVAVELRRTWKDRRHLEEMIARYDEELGIQVVWWYVPADQVLRIVRFLRSIRGEGRYVVREIPPFLVR